MKNDDPNPIEFSDRAIYFGAVPPERTEPYSHGICYSADWRLDFEGPAISLDEPDDDD